MAGATTYHTYYQSPVGNLHLIGARKALLSIQFPSESQTREPGEDWVRKDEIFTDIIQQLDQYFSGSRTEFSIPIELIGTEFQRKVWAALIEIPFGSTASYGEVATRIGQPTASRAVGAANNANPIPIIVPCHRVIGADNSMTGFGGGVETKIRLLELENRFSSSLKAQGDLFY